MKELELPDTVPVMTLPETVFFPQSLLPLHIFEPRYRQMLRDVLSGNRLFAVAQLDTRLSASQPDSHEPPCRIASLGVVRACQKAEDETSNLLLQGLCRIEVVDIVRERPYRLISIRALSSSHGGNSSQLEAARTEVIRLIGLRQRLGGATPPGIANFLKTIEDADTFVDLAAFNLCEDGRLKQTLLETLPTLRRLELYRAHLKAEVEAIRLRRKLQGKIPDDDISGN